jgi:hypothetical protein
MTSRSFPLRWSAKPFLLVPVAILAGCVILTGCGGGGSSEPLTQTVHGTGFRFAAPPGWRVTHGKDLSAATSGNVNRIEVRTFKLSRPYEDAHFRAATRELDSVIARLAAQLEGKVTSRRTIRVDGHRSRSYVIGYDGKTQEITFVLRGRQEHQLLCRRLASGDDAPCEGLLASFVLSGSAA